MTPPLLVQYIVYICTAVRKISIRTRSKVTKKCEPSEPTPYFNLATNEEKKRP